MVFSKVAGARSIVAVAVALGAAANAQTPLSGESRQTADLVLRGGAVFTADTENPAASAVAVRDGRIV